MQKERRQSEKDWHENLYRGRGDRELIVAPEIKKRYLQQQGHPLFHLELMFRLVGNVRGKNILCFGCGDENSTVLLAFKGAEVWAFDLSYEAIRLQRRMAIANGVEGQVHALVCAAEQLPFRDKHFDIVFGSGILHHLPDSLPTLPFQLASILKEDGFALFCEPVVRSQLLRRVRAIFPARQDLSPGERQLTDDDWRAWTEYFDVEFFPFHVLARVARFVLDGPLEFAARWRRSIIYFLHALDYWLLRVSFFQQFAGILVMRASPTRGRGVSNL